MPADFHAALLRGLVVPAHPLALTADRRLDERRQRALTRYYLGAGAGGVAVGVHTTQFAIRDKGLYEPVLALAADELRRSGTVRIAGICGERAQALREAETAVGLSYQVGLLSLAALRDATDQQLLDHLRAVSEVIPIMGFYLQPAVGGRALSPDFWHRAAEIERLVAIKVAPFNRYQTLDVVRAVAASGRAGEIALYTGNDDNILGDLLTRFCLHDVTLRFRGGLLGQWAVWTRRAVETLERVRSNRDAADLLSLGAQLTDANAALFDAANGFRGCIAGIHEILRRQGLLSGRWCLDEEEDLSPGQMKEIDRVTNAYPHLTDDEFVRENLDRWLR
jgi:dihydrodipicolinate synthase/N-acetylneuraminate lyase